MRLFLLGAVACCIAQTVSAGPLTEARVNKIINEVMVVDPDTGARAASLNEVIKDQIGLKTGIKSRSELLFQDDTLTRVGPETYFSFTAGTRDMALQQGTMLLQVPKGLGGAKIRTAAVTAAITGTTVMLEHTPGKQIKVLVLEGSMRLSVNGVLGESVMLTAGRMVVMHPDARRIPEPTTVDLASLVRTSPLVRMSKHDALPSMPLIQEEIDLQIRAQGQDGVIPTSLAMLSGGATADDTWARTLDDRHRSSLGDENGLGGADPAPTATPQTTATPAPSATPTPAPSATPTPAPSATPTPAPSATPTPAPSATPTPAPSATPTPAPSATPTPAPSATPTPAPSATPTPAPSATPTPAPSATPTPAPSATPTPAPSATPTPAPSATPTPAPSATPTPAPSATPTPTPTATPTPTPDPNVDPGPSGPNAPLTTIAAPDPYRITSGTLITTTRGAITIKTGAATNSGTVYDSIANDGSLPLFLYGTARPFDTSSGFDQLALDPSLPIALYRFVNLEIAGAPTYDLSRGPKSIGLIAEKDITDLSPGGSWNLSPLNALLLATKDGDITLTSLLNFSGTGAQLFIYARGSGSNLLLGSPISLTTGSVRLFAENDMTVSGAISAANVYADADHHMTFSAPINASGLVDFNARGDFTLTAGTITANVFTIDSDKFSLGAGTAINAASITIKAAGDILAGGASSVLNGTNVSLSAIGRITLNTSSTGQTRVDLAGLNSLNVQAKKITLLNDVTMPNGAVGILKGLGEGIDASGFNLRNFDTVSTNGGSLNVHHLDARLLSTTSGNATITGNLTVENAQVDGDLKVTGVTSARPGVATTYLTAKKFDLNGGLQFAGTNAGLLLSAPTAGGHAVLNSTYGDIEFDTTSGAITSANFDGGSAATLLNLTGGGDGGTLEVGTDTQPTAGKIIVDKEITASSGANGLLATTGGRGGTVKMVTTDEAQINSTIKVSDSAAGRASARGGHISITSKKTSGTAIAVTSSAQLLALLSNAAPGPGGTIKLTSAGGDVNVSGTVRADKGAVEIRNTGSNGVINVTNANLRGDTVKALALGSDGQLVISGGTISADTLINLYAGGSNGTVKFEESVTLSGNSVKTIQGNTVTIKDGKIVTISGPAPASVFTNIPNYTGSGGNGSTTGTFGGQGATTAPLSSGPGY